MRRTPIRTLLAAAALLALTLPTACTAPPERPAAGDAEVVLRTTAGDIRLLLDGRTPRHRDNFLGLVRTGFFDSLLFHRVIAGFMIQSGDPDSRHAAPGAPLGEADAGYTLPAEILYPALAHTRGALAAARTGDDTNPGRRSSGSQFYLVWGRTFADDELQALARRTGTPQPDSLRRLYATLGGTPHLDGQYTVFGRVAEGLDAVEAIQRAATGPDDRPLADIRILSAAILREPGAPASAAAEAERPGGERAESQTSEPPVTETNASEAAAPETPNPENRPRR
jgi:peptidyl-prolyl cis-trans isomerase B (cyclophilin B)